MDWLRQNPAIAIQAGLTLVGSAVAIWIALFQHRSSTRRERMALEYKAYSSAPLIAAAFLDFAMDVAARLAVLMSFDEKFESVDKILAKTKLIIPDRLALDFDKSQLFGYKLSEALARISIEVELYNDTITVESRIKSIERMGLALRSLDKTLSYYYDMK